MSFGGLLLASHIGPHGRRFLLEYEGLSTSLRTPNRMLDGGLANDSNLTRCRCVRRRRKRLLRLPVWLVILVGRLC